MSKYLITIMMAGLYLMAMCAIKAQEPAIDNPALSQTIDEAAGLAAWEKVHKVFSHPRCSNCHVADGRPIWSGPNYGATRIHGMNVGGDPDALLGNPGMMCTTCHMAENSTAPHGPPGAEFWFLPPKEFVWWQQSSKTICEQVRDPSRNGGRSLVDIEHHIAEDPLVAWGWAPGPGREPAPFSAHETAAFIALWAENGAPCPAE